MRIYNLTQKTLIAQHAVLADTFVSRARGLLGRSHLSAEEALVITHCQAIHMFFMAFSIDVIFTDRQDRVVGLVKQIKPFHVSPVFFQAFYAIELPAGTIMRTTTSLGDRVVCQKD